MVRTAADRWKRVKRAPLDLLKAAAAQPFDDGSLLGADGSELPKSTSKTRPPRAKGKKKRIKNTSRLLGKMVIMILVNIF